MERQRLESIIAGFPAARIMVVGDVMLDEYVQGSVERISPEAPIPVVNLVNGRDRDVRMGGAANVFNNLVSLGVRGARLCGVVGDDRNGALVRGRIAEGCGSDETLLVDRSRPTSVKTRIIAQNQQVIRLDREERAPIDEPIRRRLAATILDRVGDLDAVVFSDYEKGVITAGLLEEVLPELRRRGVLIAVDPKFTNFRHFLDATVIVPNRKEASGFVRHDIETEADVLAAARDILETLRCEYVLIKLGELGMRLVDRYGGDVRIETAAEQVYDVTGAGDTVISTLVLARSAGATWEEAARIANVAAGIVIHFIGTSAVTTAQLTRAMLHNEFPEP